MSVETNDWLLACDVDDTLVPTKGHSTAEREAGAQALDTLRAAIAKERQNRRVYFGVATGLTIPNLLDYERRLPQFAAAAAIMDFAITSVGTVVSRRTTHGWQPVVDWPPHTGWNRGAIAEVVAGHAGVEVQPPPAQDTYKLSYFILGESAAQQATVDTINAQLAQLKLPTQVIYSSQRFLDFLPKGVDKGTGFEHMVGTMAAGAFFTVMAGDSLNDLAALRTADLAILPGNAHDELRRQAGCTIPPEQLYQATGMHAAGVLEGLREHGLVTS